MNDLDPEAIAQMYVMQWMHENGLHEALKSLEKQLGKLYDETQLPKASQLMQLVWRHVEERLQQQYEEEEEDESIREADGRTVKRRHHEEALQLLRAGNDDYAARTVLVDVPPEIHRANIIAVRLVPGQDQVITASGDGFVRCLSYSAHGAADTEVLWETRVGSAALLSLALHPCYSSGLPLIAVGGMDGRVAVLHGATGSLLTTSQPHAKYVVRVAWGGVGPGLGSSAGAAPPQYGEGNEAPGPSAEQGQRLLLLSASMDETLAVQHLEVGPGMEAAAAEPTAAKLASVKQVPYGAAVNDVAFLHDGRTAVISVRGSNYLRLLDTAELVRQQGAGGGGSGAVPEQLVNMNEAGDDHVSFSAKQLVVSPCGQYLLVCTDGPRLLVLRTSDWSHLRLIFGLPVDQFPQPAAAWHRDSNYLYVSGANAQLCVFHLGSGRMVHVSGHHKINVRDVDYDPLRNLLATCSFDKTVKLLGPGPVAAGATAPSAEQNAAAGPSAGAPEGSAGSGEAKAGAA